MSWETTNLLSGWSVRTSGEVGAWGSGGTPKRGVDGYYGGTIPWIKISDLNGGIATDTEESITEEGLRCSSAKLIERDVLLVAMYGSIGKLGITGGPCATNQAIAFCKPDTKLVSTAFLFHLLTHLRTTLIDLAKGGTQPNISQTVLRELRVLLPPLNVQAQIVDLLDRVSLSRRRTLEQLVGARQAIERFRQAVLAAACSGRLTADWLGEHLEAPVASDLLADALAKEPRNKGQRTSELDASDLPELPSTWAWVPLSAVADGVLGKMLDKEKNRGELLSYLRNVNVRWGRFDLTDVKEMRFEEDEAVRYGLIDGDVVICEGGEPGRAAVWHDEWPDMRFQKALHRVRCDETLDPEWLVAVLRWHATAGKLGDYFTGSGIAHLTGVSLAKLPLPLPPRSEQGAAVAILRQIEAQTDELAWRLADVEFAVERTSRATLARAFTVDNGTASAGA